MGTEERLEVVEETLFELLRMDDVELGNVLAVDVSESRTGRNLAEGRGEGTRIVCQFGTASIGHELTFA